MTIFFMGGEMGAFIPSDANAKEYTHPGSYDATFARCSMEAQGSVAYNESASWTAQDTLWIHFSVTEGAGSGGSSAVYPMVLLDASNTPLFRVHWNYSSQTMQMQYWDGAAFQTAGSAFSINADSAIQPIDLYIQGNDATGDCAIYVSGTERASATVDLSSVTNMTKLRSYGRGSVSGTSISQVVVSDEPTIGFRLLSRYMNGAGATGDWTGGYTSVDETVYSDADFINSSTNGQVETFTQTGPAITGYVVRAVSVAARAKRGASGPANLQLALRSAGTDYFSASQALGLGYGAHINVWETNPATSADWVNTAIDALQPGVKAIT